MPELKEQGINLSTRSGAPALERTARRLQPPLLSRTFLEAGASERGAAASKNVLRLKALAPRNRPATIESVPGRSSFAYSVPHMSTAPKYYLSPTQYLVKERKAEFKSQYYRGEMFAMAGASREHNLIVGNLVREIGNALKDRRCEVYPSDMRVKVTATGLYTYPDATVVCGDPEFEDDQFDTLTNPTVLFEVLSDSTESWDRGGKFRQYRDIPSLKEYVMVTQDRASVERYIRQTDGGWLLKEIESTEASVRFDSINVMVPLAEIYRNIRFEDAEKQ